MKKARRNPKMWLHWGAIQTLGSFGGMPIWKKMRNLSFWIGICRKIFVCPTKFVGQKLCHFVQFALLAETKFQRHESHITVNRCMRFDRRAIYQNLLMGDLQSYSILFHAQYAQLLFVHNKIFCIHLLAYSLEKVKIRHSVFFIFKSWTFPI